MNRRDFMLLTAAVTTVPALPAFAGVDGALEYTPGMVDDLLGKGKTVFVDFSATWCGTCKAQERVINALKADNPDYNAITFVNVDWDNYGAGELSTWLNIPRRSTLVVLKGEDELGRIIAGTSKGAIKKLMDVALGAAVA